MLYRSTRGQSPDATSREAVVKGIAPDGGLYVPAEIPQFEPGELVELAGLPYAGRALRVLEKYFDDIPGDALARCVNVAWGEGSRFDEEGVAPLKAVEDVYIMELWHGPTCAFKDAALQFLPRVLDVSRRSLGIEENTLILVATSGDTGKAALEGFRDVPGTHCAVFWPQGGVSGVQRLQMLTQQGSNVSAIAVRGNFDDAQTGVKQIFNDGALNERMKSAGWALSSATGAAWPRRSPTMSPHGASFTPRARSARMRKSTS
jgi:threonine synthase